MNDAPDSEPSPQILEARRWRDAFGDRGCVWFAEGKTWEQAQQLHAQHIAAAKDDGVRELRDRLTNLEARLRAGELAKGEATPVGFQTTEDPGRSSGRGFASRIRFAPDAEPKPGT